MRRLIFGGLRGAWAPILVFTLHVISSRATDLYRVWPLLDDCMHLAGGAAISWFFACVISRLSTLRASPWTTAIGVFALTCTAAMFWEFAEFLSDRYLGTRAQGDLNDTLLDMFLGVVGGILCIVAHELARRAGA